MLRGAGFSLRGHCENRSRTISIKILSLSLEYTISKALSDYVELNFKDKEQSSFTGDTQHGKVYNLDSPRF